MDERVWIIGVRDLQQRLSRVLDSAASGEVFRVTSRGRVKALIVPPSAEGWIAMSMDFIRDHARTEQGIREGWIRPRVVDESPEIPERGSAGKVSIAEALAADREE